MSSDELIYLATNAGRTSSGEVNALFMVIAFNKASNL